MRNNIYMYYLLDTNLRSYKYVLNDAGFMYKQICKLCFGIRSPFVALESPLSEVGGSYHICHKAGYLK